MPREGGLLVPIQLETDHNSLWLWRLDLHHPPEDRTMFRLPKMLMLCPCGFGSSLGLLCRELLDSSLGCSRDRNRGFVLWCTSCMGKFEILSDEPNHNRLPLQKKFIHFYRSTKDLQKTASKSAYQWLNPCYLSTCTKYRRGDNNCHAVDASQTPRGGRHRN